MRDVERTVDERSAEEAAEWMTDGEMMRQEGL